MEKIVWSVELSPYFKPNRTGQRSKRVNRLAGGVTVVLNLMRVD